MMHTRNQRLPKTRLWTIAVALAAMLGLTATAARADSSAARPHHGGPAGQLAQAWAATAKFHSINAARKAGYEPVGPCVQTPAGALGIPYGNLALLARNCRAVSGGAARSVCAGRAGCAPHRLRALRP